MKILNHFKVFFILLIPIFSFAQFDPSPATPGAVYVVTLDIEEGPSEASNLGILNPSTGVVSSIGAIVNYESEAPPIGFVSGIAINSAGQMYGIANNFVGEGPGGQVSSLIEIDPATGEAEILSQIQLEDFGGEGGQEGGPPLFKSHMAFDANDGLYATSLFSGAVYQINIQTGVCTIVDGIGSGIGMEFGEAFLGLDKSPLDDLLYSIRLQFVDGPGGIDLATLDLLEPEVNVLGALNIESEFSPFNDIFFDASGALYFIGDPPFQDQDQTPDNVDKFTNRMPLNQGLFSINLVDFSVSELFDISGTNGNVIFTASLAPPAALAVPGSTYVTTGGQDGSRLGTIDPATGAISIIGPVAYFEGEEEFNTRSLQGLAVNTEGEIWVSGRFGRGNNETEIGQADLAGNLLLPPEFTDFLAMVDPNSGTILTVFERMVESDEDISSDWTPIAFGDDGQLYGILNAQLVSFNLATGSPTPIITGTNLDTDLYFNGMANDPNSDLIYFSAEYANEGEVGFEFGLSIWSFSPSTNTIIFLGNFVAPNGEILPDMFFTANGDLYATGNGDDPMLFQINLGSGVISPGASYNGVDLNGAGLPGAAFFPPDDPIDPGSGVPTLSQWGLIMLSLIMLIFGIVAIRQVQGKIVSVKE